MEDGSGGEGRVFFFIFKHLWAQNKCWKIYLGCPGKSWKSPRFLVSKRVGTLQISSITILTSLLLHKKFTWPDIPAISVPLMCKCPLVT